MTIQAHVPADPHKDGVRPSSPASAKPPASGLAGHPAGTCDYSILTCGHPYSRRWLSAGGWVEVCGYCSECRRPNGRIFWPSSVRLLVREGGELLMYGRDGVTLYRRDPAP